MKVPCCKSLIASLGMALISQLCVAQGTFGRVANQPYSGGVTVVNRLPVSRIVGAVRAGPAPAAPIDTIVVGPVLKDAWAQARPELQAMAEAYLHERDIGGGFRTSANHLVLAEDGPLFAGWDGRGFKIRWVLVGNKLSTRIRIPGPSAQSSDPALTLPFDLALTMDVDIAGTRLTAKSMNLQVTGHRPYGRNPTGKAAIALGDLIRFVGGPDFAGQLLKQINQRPLSLTSAVNRELERLNPALERATQGAAIVPGFDQANRNVQLTIVESGPGPVVR